MRILVLSDVHANLPALEASLGAAGAFEALWNLGDTVGYGPWPNECVEIVKAHPQAIHLAGNHDRAATGRSGTEGFNAVAARAAEWTASILSKTSRVWLDELPSIAVSGAYTLAHGSPRMPELEYILSARQAAENFAWFETSYCLVGHTHRPMVVSEVGASATPALVIPEPETPYGMSQARMMLNPGSVGQPRDGDSRAAFATIDTASASIVFHRVAYDIERTLKAILAAGLPKVLGDRLAFGA
jgi:diadenosine tetraphosphatase ApaH/serine/threonine PP2A family protein phosphatase